MVAAGGQRTRGATIGLLMDSLNYKKTIPFIKIQDLFVALQSGVAYHSQGFEDEIWVVPWSACAVGSYSSGPPAGRTPQILIFKT